MEDNVLQKRCEKTGLTIDRSVFYNIGSPEILQLFDGISRIISKKDAWRGEYDDGMDGLSTISELKYTIDDKSDNPTDNIFVVHNPNINVINIKTFLTHIPFGSEEYYNYDLREPKRKIIHPDKFKETKKSVVNTNDWTNIPHYPTTREKRINVAKYLIQMGRQIPPELLRQIEEDKRKEIEEDSFNSHIQKSIQPQINQQYQPSQNNQHKPSQNNININKYSPYYAQYIGVKPKAQPSARVRLGGVY